MNSGLFVTCLLVLVGISWAQTGSLFNCKNPGNDCVNGICNDQGGCDCTSGYTFENCGVRQDQVCNTLDCGPNGICVNDGQPRCQCSAGYTGDQCQNAPLDCSCTSTAVTAVITPPGDFRQGEGYVEQFGGVTECRSAPVSSGSATHTITVPYSSPRCGNAERRSISNDGSYSVGRIFRFKYSSTLRTGNDILLQCNCVFDKTQNTIYSLIGNVDESDLRNLLLENVTRYIAPISYVITHGQGNVITDTTVLRLGEAIRIDFRTDTGYCVNIDSIVADNTLTDSRRQTSVLVANGCRTRPDGFSVMAKDPEFNSDFTVWTVTFDAFLFDESSTIGLNVTYDATTDLSQCRPPVCSSTSGRKKRQSGDKPDNKAGVIQEVFIIGDPDVLLPRSKVQEETCKMSSQLMVGLIVMASIICLLLIICVTMGLRLFLRNKPKREDSPSKYAH